jgi:hypothetical protein
MRKRRQFGLSNDCNWLKYFLFLLKQNSKRTEKNRPGDLFVSKLRAHLVMQVRLVQGIFKRRLCEGFERTGHGWRK